jgi:hypothetical protein
MDEVLLIDLEAGVIKFKSSKGSTYSAKMENFDLYCDSQNFQLSDNTKQKILIWFSCNIRKIHHFGFTIKSKSDGKNIFNKVNFGDKMYRNKGGG